MHSSRWMALYQEHQSHVLLVYLLALITNIRYLAARESYAEVAAPALALQVLGAGLYAAASPLPYVRPLSLAVGAGGGALCAALAWCTCTRCWPAPWRCSTRTCWSR